MFRISLDGPLAATYFSKQLAGSRSYMRVYKWGDKTGYFLQGAKWESAWIAEQRVLAAHAPHALLESVTPLSIEAPPPTVDDIWEEEVVTSKNCICGNILTLAGTGEELLEWLDRERIALPAAIRAVLDAAPKTKAPAAEPKAPAPTRAEPKQWLGVEEEDTPGTALPSLPPRPAFRDGPRPQQRQPGPHPGSSHGPARHPGSRGPPMGARHPPTGERSFAPRPAHTYPRPYVPHAGPGPAFHGPSHPRPGPPQRAQGHGGADRPPYERRPTGPRPPFRGPPVTEE